MLNNDRHITNLIADLSAVIADEESSVLGQGYSSPDLVAAELEDAWELAGNYKSDYQFDSNAALKSFQERISVETPGIGVETAAATSALYLFFQSTASKVFALTAAAALIAGFWFLYPEKYAELANESEQIKTFAMQDGSVMTMFPGSVLNIFKESDKSKNKVSLEGGQIYADIKISKNPLTMVLAGNQLIVSGTVFAAETSNNDVVINMFDGNGVYRYGDKIYELSPGTKVVHNLDTDVITEVDGADKSIVDFTRGSISFIDTPLEEVFDRLGSFYNVDFEYDIDKVSEKNFTSAVLDNQNLESILETIEISFDLEASKVDNRTYEVTFK